MISALKTRTALSTLCQELDTLPTTLEALYDRTFAAVVAQPEEAVDLARWVRLWIHHARRVLSIVELQYALAVRNEDANIDGERHPEKDMLLLVCRGLVVAEPDINALKFSRTYLLSTLVYVCVIASENEDIR